MSDDIGSHVSQEAQDCSSSQTAFLLGTEVAEAAIAQVAVTALPGASHIRTHKQQMGRKNDLQQRWDSLAPRGQCWFPPQGDLAHPTPCGGRKQNTYLLDGWSSSHHLPIRSRVSCQTQAAVSSVLLGTLVIVLQTAWKMWDVAEGKMIATSFAQIIWGLLYMKASTVHGVSVKQ